MLGLGLYIGEGTKTQDIVRMINSDPKVIQLALKWFIDICGLKKENITIRLHLYPDNNEKKCVMYWSKQTGLPIAQFQKTQVDIRANKRVVKRGKLPYGTAHITVRGAGNKRHGVYLARLIAAWSNEALNKAGVVQW